jgi:hypothetical protein
MKIDITHRMLLYPKECEGVNKLAQALQTEFGGLFSLHPARGGQTSKKSQPMIGENSKL